MTEERKRWKVERIERGTCYLCGERIERGPYMGKEVHVGPLHFKVDDKCAGELADKLLGRT